MHSEHGTDYNEKGGVNRPKTTSGFVGGASANKNKQENRETDRDREREGYVKSYLVVLGDLC